MLGKSGNSIQCWVIRTWLLEEERRHAPGVRHCERDWRQTSLSIYIIDETAPTENHLPVILMLQDKRNIHCLITSPPANVTSNFGALLAKDVFISPRMYGALAGQWHALFQSIHHHVDERRGDETIQRHWHPVEGNWALYFHPNLFLPWTDFLTHPFSKTTVKEYDYSDHLQCGQRLALNWL